MVQVKELIERNFEKIDNFILESYKKFYFTQNDVDIYMYINENEIELDTYENVGGNSWIDDDHLTIYTIFPSNEQYEDIFGSKTDFIEYMKEVYGINVPDVEPTDQIVFLERNFFEKCEEAVSDIITEHWEGIDKRTLIKELEYQLN